MKEKKTKIKRDLFREIRSIKSDSKNTGITLIALVITIVVLLALAAVVVNLSLGENGIITKAQKSVDMYDKAEATEQINIKKADIQMKCISEYQRTANLQDIANGFCEDNDTEYVKLGQEIASLELIDVTGYSSIIVKLKAYAYEFEINGDFQVALVEEEKDIRVVATRDEVWNGATMLTATISNITGGTFTINVNNVEAHNYGTLYYYVDNKLVHQGTESSFQVTNIDGKPIEDGKTYKVKVLSEPFELSVTTGTGDNVDSWLACIGNTNEQGYTIDNLDELWEDKQLVTNLLSSQDAMNYLNNSTEILLPFVQTKAAFKQPTLTANTLSLPQGNVVVSSNLSYSTNGSGYQPYKAFDNTTSNFWCIGNDSRAGYIQITFPYEILITGIDIIPENQAGAKLTAYTNSSRTTAITNTISTSVIGKKYSFEVPKYMWTNTVHLYMPSHDAWFGLSEIIIHGYVL